MTRQQGAIATGVSVVVVCSLMLAWLYLNDARHSYMSAQSNLQQMQSLANDIQHLRTLQTSAQLGGEQPKQAVKPWVERTARIKAGQPTSFTASPLQSIPKSDYSQESVALTLQDLTLAQVVQFLTDPLDESEYIPTIIELRASNSSHESSSGTSEKWNANLVLTRLVYTAITPSNP